MLYHPATGLWWTWDDAFHFHQTITHRASEILFSRDFWRGLPNPVFTPLLFLSFKTSAHFDDPHPFYVRQLLSVAAAGIALYFLLRLWVPRWVAFAGALLAVVGPTMCDIADQIGHRHYVEGLVLAIGATALFVIGVRRNSLHVSAAAALLYLLAAVAKEVYVPLPALLLVIPEGTLRSRIRHLIPSAAAAGVYAIWRMAMLGLALRGYGWAIAPEDRARMMATLPLRAALRMGGANAAAGGTLMVLVAAALVVLFVRLRAARPVIIVAALLALLPIVPVSYKIETRYVLVAWVLAAAGATLLARAAPRLAPPALALLIVAALVANRFEWRRSYDLMRRMSLEGRALAGSGDGEVLLDPVVPPAAADEERWLARSENHQPAAGAVLYDALPVCGGREARFLVYDPRARRVVSMRKEEIVRAACGAIHSLPFSVRFRYHDDTLWWSAEPRDSGDYRFLLAGGVQGFDMPARGGFRIAGPPSLPIRVRYRTPAGWLGYSPELNVPLREGAQIEWHR